MIRKLDTVDTETRYGRYDRYAYQPYLRKASVFYVITRKGTTKVENDKKFIEQVTGELADKKVEWKAVPLPPACTAAV